MAFSRGHSEAGNIMAMDVNDWLRANVSDAHPNITPIQLARIIQRERPYVWATLATALDRVYDHIDNQVLLILASTENDGTSSSDEAPEAETDDGTDSDDGSGNPEGEDRASENQQKQEARRLLGLEPQQSLGEAHARPNQRKGRV